MKKSKSKSKKGVKKVKHTARPKRTVKKPLTAEAQQELELSRPAVDHSDADIAPIYISEPEELNRILKTLLDAAEEMDLAEPEDLAKIEVLRTQIEKAIPVDLVKEG